MNHDMLVVTDRMAKAIVTAMALHGFLASCIAELQQKLNDETFPCESNFGPVWQGFGSSKNSSGSVSGSSDGAASLMELEPF